MPYQILPSGPFSTDFFALFFPDYSTYCEWMVPLKLFGPSGRSPFFGCKGKTAFCLHILREERKPINVEENDYWFSFNRATDLGISVDIWCIMGVCFFVWCVDKEFRQTANLSTSLICIFCVLLVLFSPYKRNCNPADIFLYAHLSM